MDSESKRLNTDKDGLESLITACFSYTPKYIPIYWKQSSIAFKYIWINNGNEWDPLNKKVLRKLD